MRDRAALVRHGCFAVALALVVLHFARFDVPERPLVTDVRYTVYFATRVADGAVPHRDFFENRPQLATLAGAALIRAGRPLGVDPLRAMRLGYIALAALLALFLFAVHRALRDGDCVAGLLGLVCSLGFPLLGLLPSIGPVPKLLMGILALGAALLALRGRWLLAGFAGGLAALDWQIGALAGLGVLLAAACEARVARLRACVAVACGGLAAAVLFVAYFAWHGALGDAVQQIVASSLARGAASTSRAGRTLRVGSILAAFDLAAPGMRWLLWAGLAGMALLPGLLVRLWRRPARRLAIVLAVYGYGLAAFSLLDFQGFGDLLALLAVIAFFAGVAVGDAWVVLRWLVRRATGRDAAPGRVARLEVALAAAAVVVLALAVGALRNPVAPLPPSRLGRAGETLTDQREVARQLAALGAGRKVVFAGCTEQLYLTGSVNPLPFIFWNTATLSYYGASPDEELIDGLERVLREAEPDVIVCARPKAQRRLVESGDFRPVALEAPSGRYRIWLAVAARE